MSAYTHRLFIMCLALGLTGCAMRPIQSPDHITVEGYAIVMGNEPFAALVLTTDNQNSYVLKMDAAMRAELMTPAILQVKGRLYLDDWAARPYAHIEVLEFSKLPD